MIQTGNIIESVELVVKRALILWVTGLAAGRIAICAWDPAKAFMQEVGEKSRKRLSVASMAYPLHRGVRSPFDRNIRTCRVIMLESIDIQRTYSEALASVAAEVRKLRDRVPQLEGAGVPYEPLPESLQRIMEDLDYQI